MRELRPLQLPNLIANKHSLSLSANEANSACTSQSSTAGEISWTASDCSTPATPTSSVHGHSRYPSSNSSVGSTSSPSLDLPDAAGATAKLPMPKLPEDPLEREDHSPGAQEQIYAMNKSSFDEEAFEDVISTRPTVILGNSDNFDFGNDLFHDECQSSRKQVAKRQSSADSPVGMISSRLGERFPSFSRRRTHKKKDSKISDASLHILTSSLPPSTRSSSVSSSIYHSPDHIETSPGFLSQDTVAVDSIPVSPIDIKRTDEEAPIDREKLASTPLLPPLVTALSQSNDELVQSPLQSPTVAESSSRFSSASTPAETPQLRGIPSPPLSTRPSIASFHRPRMGTLPSSDIPPLIIADPNDEWSMKLGHANFTIFPEPYLPDVFNTETYHRLVADWEEARVNYFKHQHRTLEHYGVNSKTYKLTEQKWAAVDAQWRNNKDLAAIEAAKRSHEAIPAAPIEYASGLPMPVVPDLKDDGKFPKLGDEGIVGPMKQEPPRIQVMPVRRNALVKFFDNLKTPGGLFGRSRTARQPI